MEDETRPGYYRDENGGWHKDRRKKQDRRLRTSPFNHHDRRAVYRRKTDREIHERDAREQIEEALEDFAAEQETDE